jgi:hypothetical protein
MAFVYVREYKQLAREAFGGTGIAIQAGLEPGLKDQTIAIGASSLACEGFQNDTAFVMIHTDAICSIVFGANPNATANNMRLPANATVYFGVPPGKGFKVAVITNT